MTTVSNGAGTTEVLLQAQRMGKEMGGHAPPSPDWHALWPAVLRPTKTPTLASVVLIEGQTLPHLGTLHQTHGGEDAKKK